MRPSFPRLFLALVPLPTLMLAAALTPAARAQQDIALTMPAPVAGLVAEAESEASFDLPVGVFDGARVPVERVRGALDRRAWQLVAPRLTLDELADPLESQLQAQGFGVVLDCDARACGGFDFRFGIEVMSEPAMHVDLGEFRFISARRGDEAVALMISRSPGFGFVQMTRVGPLPLPAPEEVPETPGTAGASADPAPDLALPVDGVPAEAPAAPLAPVAPVAPLAPEADAGAGPGVAVAPADLAAALVANGAVALDDLVFASGAAALEEGDYASLSALADWLKADPARSVALVGHTDSQGALAGNIALSKKRAEGVRQVLLMRYGVAKGQVIAEGVGPLAPRDSNLTEAGRQKNRRVEAVMTSTQ